MLLLYQETDYTAKNGQLKRLSLELSLFLFSRRRYIGETYLPLKSGCRFSKNA